MSDEMIGTPENPQFISKSVVPGPSGKPTFIGRHQDVPKKPVGEGSKMKCPICHNLVNYLVGEDTNDGGRQGCEGCWKPGRNKPSQPASPASQNGAKEIPFV